MTKIGDSTGVRRDLLSGFRNTWRWKGLAPCLLRASKSVSHSVVCTLLHGKARRVPGSSEQASRGAAAGSLARLGHCSHSGVSTQGALLFSSFCKCLPWLSIHPAHATDSKTLCCCRFCLDGEMALCTPGTGGVEYCSPPNTGDRDTPKGQEGRNWVAETAQAEPSARAMGGCGLRLCPVFQQDIAKLLPAQRGLSLAPAAGAGQTGT